MALLVLNAGSSSLKGALFEEDGRSVRARASVEWRGEAAAATLTLSRGATGLREATEPIGGIAEGVARIGRALLDEKLLASFKEIRAIGQRVVHGGTAFQSPVRLDARVRAEIEKLSELAPLHNPPALESIAGAEAAFPGAPQIAVFDTAYYATLEPRRFVYPLPYKWFEDWGIRRFGFHGISHDYIAGRAGEVLGRGDLRLISGHLGNGCSVTASRSGQAVATTMGFTPLEGLMMGTRSGSIDPGILLYVQRQQGLDAAALEKTLNHESGLQGVSGISRDLRVIEEAAASRNARARLAFELFADRAREAIAAMAVTLGGLDALVFTAGIGEHSAAMRAAIGEGLGCLSITIDPEKNRHARADCAITGDDSKIPVLVLHTDEESLIARETARLATDPP
jgi:acetate kinase